MKLNKYIAVVPIIEGTLDLLKLTERSYVWVPLWDDLRCLHGKCLLGQFKIFVDQEDPPSTQPKLFVCTLIEAQTLEQAYESAAQRMRAFAANLVTFSVCSRGFEPIIGDMQVTEFYPPKSPPAIKDKVDLDLVEITIGKGNLKTIRTPYYLFKFSYPLGCQFSHNQYITAYSTLQKLEAPQPTQMPDVRLLQKKELQNIESHLDKIIGSGYTDEAKLMNVIAPIYSAAVTAKNMLMSYVLLWQVLESIASTRDFGKKLLDKNTMNGIRALLQQQRYDNTAISRLNSMLGTVKQKNEIDVIAETLRDYVYPAEALEKLKKSVEILRNMRGAIVHPRVCRTLREPEIMERYRELRHIVDSLVQKLSRKVCGS